ncbi:MBL fold metallo-hydrolase [Streptomyces sp. NBC_00094]|uniref:MBL fold metallo-hydrolase n=1 Tax=Streptomyces sp. NBC_00094 TaxID=2903620 RepID=UPI0022584127|nr:MBL fold metallo-hydrolase [Streptomyces sp. NBC_00094]MCX5389159.1 MBL fold metallo-hydrolase [Streptomyces sp. NBC_00094]
MELLTITPRLHLLDFSIGQAYLWRDEEELTLIDAGWAGSADATTAAIRAAGLDPDLLRRIVLTHCHRDHVGAAQELADRHGAEILAHRLDAPVIRGEDPVPEPDLLEWELPLYEHGLTVPVAPPTRVDREVEDGEELGFGDGAVAVHTPGHTPGSLAVHLPRHGVLFTGDTVASVQGVTFGVFHVDRPLAMESMRRLAKLAPTVLCCGHGAPVTTDTADRLAAAADQKGTV